MNNRIYLRYSTDIQEVIDFIETFYSKLDYRVGYDNMLPDIDTGMRNFVEIILDGESSEETFLNMLQYGSIANHFQEYMNT